MILELKKRKSVTVSTFSPSICCEMMGPNAMILVFLMLSFKPALSLSSFTLIERLFSSSSLPLEWYHQRIWSCWYFSQQSWFQLVARPAWHFSLCTLLISEINGVRLYSLVLVLSQSWLVICSMEGSNCCFLPRIQVSQETGKVVWYSHLFYSFSMVCYDPYSQRLSHSRWSRNDCFSGIPLLTLSSNGCWQFVPRFLYLF